MDTLAIDHDNELDDPGRSYLPGRPRRRLLNELTVPLLALLLAAIGFLVGIEVEKDNGSTGSTSVAGSSFSAAGVSGRARAGASRFPRSGFPGGSGPTAAGFGGARGGGTTGTVSSVTGRKIALKTTSGNTIEVTLSSATKLKKELSVTRNAIHPGDSITVEGLSGKGGSINASSISDSGSSARSSSSASNSARTS
jgi:hypothetical protein